MVCVELVLDVDEEGENHLILERRFSTELTHTELVIILSDRHQINVYVLNFLIAKLLSLIKSEN